MAFRLIALRLSIPHFAQVLIDGLAIHATASRSFAVAVRIATSSSRARIACLSCELLGDQFHIGLGLCIGGVILNDMDEMAQSRHQTFFLIGLNPLRKFGRSGFRPDVRRGGQKEQEKW